MAVYTKINQTEIQIIENKFNIGKILSFSGIKKGIETAGENYDRAIGSIEKRIMPQIKKISNLGTMKKIDDKNVPGKTRINLRKKLSKK